jgi:hypothetical protein
MLTHGSFGERLVVISALGLLPDIALRYRTVLQLGLPGGLVLVALRSLVDSLLLTIVWHASHALNRRDDKNAETDVRDHK